MGMKNTIYGIGNDFFNGMRNGFTPTRLRSRGRGLAHGKGKGPVGFPYSYKSSGIGSGRFRNIGF